MTTIRIEVRPGTPLDDIIGPMLRRIVREQVEALTGDDIDDAPPTENDA